MIHGIPGKVCVFVLQYQQVRNKWANWLMIRDVKRRRMSAENFLERTRINAMRKNDILPVEIRELADKDINKFELNATPMRINNRCVITSRLVSSLFNILFSKVFHHHPIAVDC